MIKKTVVYMLAKTKITMPTSKPLFYEFTTRKQYRVPSQNFVNKNFLCEEGDEITRCDGTVCGKLYTVVQQNKLEVDDTLRSN
jgi:hypothetical protein